MGFKTSMIMVKQPPAEISNEQLLDKLGLLDFARTDDTTFEQCMYPRDKSINIGHYNNCLIICDDYQLTTSLELSKDPQELSDYENTLTKIYPDCEILTVACHSAVNYHLYSLVKNGQKIRFKKVVGEEPLFEFGNRIAEEEKVYAYSTDINGERMFRSTYKENDVYDNTEDQMMEAFAFGVAKRHLGVMISMDEDEELMETSFTKYLSNKQPKRTTEVREHPKETVPSKSSWLSRLFKKA